MTTFVPGPVGRPAAWLLLGLAALLVTSCDLEVTNESSPDRERVLSEPDDVESLVGNSFLIWHTAVYWGCPELTMTLIGEENTTNPGNGCANRNLSLEPRPPFNNDPLYSGRWVIQYPYPILYENLSSLYDALTTFAADSQGVFADAIDVPRARAFAKFTQGLTLGWIALTFDSAFVLDETVVLETDTLTRLPYPLVMDKAISYFDSAIALSSGAGWTLDPSWIRDNAFTAAEFAALVHDYKARYMSLVARTPAERDALDWDAIVDAVDRGRGVDLLVGSDGGDQWWHLGNALDANTWGRADYKTIGYTDTSGRYADWLATGFNGRDQFELLTPDARITGDPADGTVRGTDFRYVKSSFGFAPFNSSYVHDRYGDWVANGMTGDMRFMSADVQQLIKAEGLLRLGNQGAAATIVNVTRVGRGGLPPVTASDPNLMSDLIYEHVIEDFNLCNWCPYFNRRGWGPLSDTRGNPPGTHHWGLVEGTLLHFPLPGSQLELRGQALYTYGGIGTEGGSLSASAPSRATARTGVPATAVYIPAPDGNRALRFARIIADAKSQRGMFSDLVPYRRR